jgi:hypothetical protein
MSRYNNRNRQGCSGCSRRSCSCGGRGRNHNDQEYYDRQKGYGDPYDNDGVRETGSYFQKEMLEIGKNTYKETSSADPEQKLVLAMEAVFLVAIIGMIGVAFHDIVGQLGGDPDFFFGSGITASEYGGASGWYAFFLTMGIVQTVSLAGMFYYHYATLEKESTIGKRSEYYWQHHTRHYIAAMCSNGVFRALSFYVAAIFMAEISSSGMRVHKGATASFTNAIDIASNATAATRAMIESENENITSNNNEFLRVEVGIVYLHTLLVLMFALAMLVLMIPRAITLMQTILHDSEAIAHETAKEAAVDEVDHAMSTNTTDP